MNIYIDELGSFVNSPRVGSWNVVSAYTTPETETRRLDALLRNLKLRCGKDHSDEIKLKNVDENIYFSFLAKLISAKGIVFCSATDAGYNTVENVKYHQKTQAEMMLEHIDKLIYESGRQAVEYVADQVRELSPQLYVQLLCQVDLIHNVVGRAITYFVQRQPNSLRKFKWKIDQKNSKRIDFEDAFEKICPILLQSRSLKDPIIMIKEYDYSCMKNYIYEEGEAPAYLKEIYGLNVSSGLNIQKIVRDDITFDDSKKVAGIQVVDLIASGIRRCLRGWFNKNDVAAALLGRLMVQNFNEKPPLNLLSFYDGEPDETSRRAVVIMSRNARNFMV